MTFLRLGALVLLLVLGLSVAACSVVGCRSENVPVYVDPGKPTGEPHKGAQE